MNYKLQDITLQLGSLMQIENRTAFFDVFNNKDITQTKELSTFNKLTKDKKLLIDVGCQYAPLSLSFAKLNPDSVIYAFDGGINPFLTVSQTKTINGFKNYYIYNNLIGDKDEMVKCFSEPHQSLAINGDDNKLMLTIDTFVSIHDLYPDCIKIDIEGCELKALKGAFNTIQTHRPIIFIEIHPKFIQMYNTTISDIIQYVSDISYNIIDLDGDIIENYSEVLYNEPTDSHRAIWIPKETNMKDLQC
jgi:FkbM family methyltransferase